MFSGTITFLAAYNPAQYSYLQACLQHDKLDKFTINITEDEIKINFFILFTKRSDLDDLLIKNKVLCDNILNKISFFSETQIYSPRFEGADFTSLFGYRYKHKPRKVVSLRSSWSVLSYDMADKLRLLLTTEDSKDIFYKMFRCAVNTEDDISRFIILYTLLLYLSNDSCDLQSRVDDLIKSIDPNIPITKSPHKKDATETLYTRLRNELSHKRDNIDLESTQKEITENIDKFKKLVKEAIYRK